MGLKTGDAVRWHIRPEVHVEHGGYMETEPLTGVIHSVHPTHVMVAQGPDTRSSILDLFLKHGCRPRYAVLHGNPSLKRTPNNAKAHD
jgi:hypothetical protein